MARRKGVSGWKLGGGVAAAALLLIGGAAIANKTNEVEEALGRYIDELIAFLDSEKGKQWSALALDVLEAEISKRLPFPLDRLLDIVWEVERQSVAGKIHKAHKRSRAIAMAKRLNLPLAA